MSTKDPAFPFYAQDFLTGVMYLTNEEVGMYVKMLSKQWTDGKIPKKRLGLLVGLNWESMPDELKNKFEDLGEYVVNTRLESEREKRKAFKKKQSNNGKKGGRPRNEENPNKTQTQSQKKPLEDENENDNENVIDIKNKYFEKSEKLLSTDVDPETFVDIATLQDLIKNEFTWREIICRNLREVIPKFSEEDFNGYLQQFFKQISNDGETVKTVQDTKKHFSRWLNIEIKKNGNRIDNNPRSDSDLKRSASDAVDKMFSGQQQL